MVSFVLKSLAKPRGTLALVALTAGFFRSWADCGIPQYTVSSKNEDVLHSESERKR